MSLSARPIGLGKTPKTRAARTGGTKGAGVLFPVQAHGETALKIHHTSRAVALVREGPQWPHGLGGDGTRQAGEQPGAEK